MEKTLSPENKIIGMIASLRESYNKFIETELKKHGVSGMVTSHGSILSILYLNGGSLQMNEISRRVGRTKSTVTVLVDKLEKLGYIQRIDNPGDKRSSIVQLTEKGIGFRKIFEQISSRLTETAYTDFTEEEKITIVRLILKMKENFE